MSQSKPEYKMTSSELAVLCVEFRVPPKYWDEPLIAKVATYLTLLRKASTAFMASAYSKNRTDEFLMRTFKKTDQKMKSFFLDDVSADQRELFFVQKMLHSLKMEYSLIETKLCKCLFRMLFETSRLAALSGNSLDSRPKSEQKEEKSEVTESDKEKVKLFCTLYFYNVPYFLWNDETVCKVVKHVMKLTKENKMHHNLLDVLKSHQDSLVVPSANDLDSRVNEVLSSVGVQFKHQQLKLKLLKESLVLQNTVSKLSSGKSVEDRPVVMSSSMRSLSAV